MKKTKKFKFIGKALYFPEEELLVIADLHIGYEEYLNEWGILIPRRQFKETIEQLEKTIKKAEKIGKISEIVVLGDLKHEFGQISSQEWREVKEILDFLKNKTKKVILVKGNHDTILEPIAERKELEIEDFYIKDGICFLHGNKLFPECLDEKIQILVIGHRHPVVLLVDKYKREKYKCFLIGKWKGKEVIILPSFFPFVEGSDMVDEDRRNRLFISERELKKFEVYVVGEEVYGFGKLGKL